MFGKIFLACGSIIALCSDGLVAATQLSTNDLTPSPPTLVEYNDDIEFETNGLITQFSDKVMGGNVTNSDTFLNDIEDRLKAINEKIYNESSNLENEQVKNIIRNSGELKYALCNESSNLENEQVKNIIRNSGELKYALCVAVAWANKLASDTNRLGVLNKLYEDILGEHPSKECAIELVKANADSWKVFSEDFLILIEEE